MINFFRKTRKKLADDNKPLKYARYARVYKEYIDNVRLVKANIIYNTQTAVFIKDKSEEDW